MAKIAVELEHDAGTPSRGRSAGSSTPRIIARGDGWTVANVLCRCGPQDPPLATRTHKVLDVAFDCGFGDVSNFNRAFRTEFGVGPRDFQRMSR